MFAGTNIRLYTKSFFNDLTEFDPPEMETAPLEKLYVNVKQLAGKLPPFPIPGDTTGIININNPRPWGRNKIAMFEGDRFAIAFPP